MALLNRVPAPVPAIARRPRGILEPIVKWPGGKRKLVPELVARMPVSYGRYYEPFAGGAALFLHCEPEHAVLADANADLINLYRQVADRTNTVVHELGLHAQRHSPTFYTSMRSTWNHGPQPHIGPGWAAAFLYLNKTCFNGLWRVNSKGEFNVPMGDYKNPAICNEPALLAAAPAFARALLRTCDYREAVAGAREGDFVYFDPPYIPLNPTSSFTAYTAGGFGEAKQRELAALARDLVGRGVQVLLSNSDTTLAWELYSGFRIDRVSRSGAINSDPSKRGAVSELIIAGGYPAPASKPAASVAAQAFNKRMEKVTK